MTVESLLANADDTPLLNKECVIKPQRKFKVLMLSDHPLGLVGLVSRQDFLLKGWLQPVDGRSGVWVA
jgi:hypothetical protein